MSASRFEVVNENPNEITGGGGCVCSETKQPDCVGPFVVFYAQSLETVQSPHVVACAKCINDAHQAVVRKIDAELEEPIDVEFEDDVPLI